MHGFTEYLFSGLLIIKVLFLNKSLIYFKVAFNPAFLTSAGNSCKLLGSAIKCSTYEPNYPKVGNELFISI